MQETHKYVIECNYSTLVSDCRDEDRIIEILLKKGLLSSSSKEIIYNAQGSYERRIALFHEIPNCEDEAFTELILAFEETNQKSLATLLKSHCKCYVTTDGEISIAVKYSENFCDTENVVPTYICRSKNRGRVLIVNINEFTNLKTRYGSQYDVHNLKNLFISINFETELVMDQNAKDMQDAVFNFFRTSVKYDCCFVIIMSHGGQDDNGTYFYGKDCNKVYTNAIQQYATTVICNHLSGVPKVILYNICRGEKADLGTEVPMTKTAMDVAGFTIQHTLKDLLIGNATTKDYVSHRDLATGAWYIRNLVNVMAEYANTLHMEDMLKIVNDRVAKLKNNDPSSHSMQIATYTNIGFKQLYLNPGIYEEGGQLKHFSTEDNAQAGSSSVVTTD